MCFIERLSRKVLRTLLKRENWSRSVSKTLAINFIQQQSAEERFNDRWSWLTSFNTFSSVVATSLQSKARRTCGDISDCCSILRIYSCFKKTSRLKRQREQSLSKILRSSS